MVYINREQLMQIQALQACEQRFYSAWAKGLNQRPLGMTLEEVKASAPRLGYFGEYQFIVGEPDDCELITMFGSGLLSEPHTANEKRVLCYRTFDATNYANDQQGEWVLK